MRKLNPKTKAKWVAALRSGEYKQACGQLKTAAGGYCCLGVLRDVVKPASEDSDAYMSVAYIRDRHGEYQLLPADVQQGLADVNDAGVPFEVIAGLIHRDL